jgi:hypothetical protein
MPAINTTKPEPNQAPGKFPTLEFQSHCLLGTRRPLQTRMPTTTIASLPYDVWARIVSFIPKDIVRKLYAVNQVLFHIAMEERYKSAYIHDVKIPLIRDWIHRLR